MFSLLNHDKKTCLKENCEANCVMSKHHKSFKAEQKKLEEKVTEKVEISPLSSGFKSSAEDDKQAKKKEIEAKKKEDREKWWENLEKIRKQGIIGSPGGLATQKSSEVWSNVPNLKNLGIVLHYIFFLSDF